MRNETVELRVLTAVIALLLLAFLAFAVWFYNNHADGDLIETLLNPDPSLQDSFAQQAAVIGNSVLIASPFESSKPGISQDGVAYLFQPKRIR